MPGRDRTGPEGEGPMTGRGLGRCSGTDKTTDEERNFTENGPGRGTGWGPFRGGRGRGGRGFGRSGRGNAR